VSMENNKTEKPFAVMAVVQTFLSLIVNP
jgi:hypothetical protein